jgi:hypothetical protein
MASSIKETPTLYGKDATRFSKKIKENETKRVSHAEKKRVIDNYNKIKKYVK